MKRLALKVPTLPNIVILGVALRLILLIYAMFVPEISYDGDSHEYLELAHHLAETGVYGAETDRPFPPDSVRPPLYPAFVALFAFLLGDGTPFLALLAQVLLSAGAIWLTHRLARQLGASDWIARLAALVLALDVSSVIYATTLMTETLFTVLLLLFASALVRTLKVPDRRNNLALAVLSAGLILTKPIASYLPLVSAGLLLWLAHERTAQKALAAVAHLALVAALVLPWALRNERKHDFFGVSTIQSFNLLYYNSALAKARTEGTGIDAAEDALTATLQQRIDLDSASTGEQAQAMQRLGWQTIARNPGNSAMLHLRGMLAMLVDPGRINLERVLYGAPGKSGLLEAFSTQGTTGAMVLLLRQQPALLIVFAAVFLWQIALLSMNAIGGIALFAKRQPILFWTLFSLIAYFLLTTGPLGAARFRVPVTPYLAIIAGYGAERLRQKLLP